MDAKARGNAVGRDQQDRHEIVHLHYSGPIAVRVRGVATGQLYRFSKTQPSQWVNREDAPSLLQTQLFREIPCQ